MVPFLATIFSQRFLPSSCGDGFLLFLEKSLIFLITFFHTVISKIPKKSEYFLWVFTHKIRPTTPKTPKIGVFGGFFHTVMPKTPKKGKAGMPSNDGFGAARRSGRPRTTLARGRFSAAAAAENGWKTTLRGQF